MQRSHLLALAVMIALTGCKKRPQEATDGVAVTTPPPDDPVDERRQERSGELAEADKVLEQRTKDDAKTPDEVRPPPVTKDANKETAQATAESEEASEEDQVEDAPAPVDDDGDALDIGGGVAGAVSSSAGSGVANGRAGASERGERMVDVVVDEEVEALDDFGDSGEDLLEDEEREAADQKPPPAPEPVADKPAEQVELASEASAVRSRRRVRAPRSRTKKEKKRRAEEPADGVAEKPSEPVTAPASASEALGPAVPGRADWSNQDGAAEAVRPVYAAASASTFVSTETFTASTFAADVDTASYSNVRRMLRSGEAPPAGAVRVEEFVNALPYDYPAPDDGQVFRVDMEATRSPWSPDRYAVRVGVQARRTEPRPLNLTVAVDVSPSMKHRLKLDLARRVVDVLGRQLGPRDSIEVVAYSDKAVVVVPRTPGDRAEGIGSRLELSDGGSALGAGLGLAYERAVASHETDEVSRVLLLADGDANLGSTTLDQLVGITQAGTNQHVSLTTLGFGGRDLNDVVLEQLADRSGGNYHFVDGIIEARRLFQQELRSTLDVVASDVKLQVRWNPTAVRSWRLVGYDNRVLDANSFRDDEVGGGDVGSGHQVTAVYEVELQPSPTGALGSVHVRHRPPGAQATGAQLDRDIPRDIIEPDLLQSSADLRLQLAAVGLAERLRGSEHVDVSYETLGDLVIGAIRPNCPEDAELLELIDRAARLTGGGLASLPGVAPY